MRHAHLTESEIAAYEARGFLNVAQVASPEEIQAANAAFEQVYEGGAHPILNGWADCVFDERLLGLATSEACEALAKQVLAADDVELFTVMVRVREPEPGATWALEWEHIDCRYSLAQLRAVPRQKLCGIYLWLTDMTPERAPLMIKPGSHWQIAETVKGADGYIGQPINACDLPDLDYAPYEMITAAAGDVTLLETACVHSGSTNLTSTARRVLVAGYRPRGSAAANGEWFAPRREAFQAALRERLPPERRHLAVRPDSPRF